ncbi:hypothetical protein Tco_0410379 [Tanacetum coccineum]
MLAKRDIYKSQGNQPQKELQGKREYDRVKSCWFIEPTKVNESRASDKGEEGEQDTRSEFERLLQQEKQTNNTNSFNTVGTLVSAAELTFTNDDPSSPVNAAEASNAFEDHLYE